VNPHLRPPTSVNARGDEGLKGGIGGRSQRKFSSRTTTASLETRSRQSGCCRDDRHQWAGEPRNPRGAMARVDQPRASVDTVIEYAARLCGAQDVQLFFSDGDVFCVERVFRRLPGGLSSPLFF